MVRVWFNHWFSTAHQIIGLMKRDATDEIYVIGSNLVMNSVIKNACDEWYADSELKGDSYVSFCIEFCKAHDIDVFAPRREMVEISRQKERFERLGVRVMADSYDKISFLGDKAKTYEFFKGNKDIKVPDYFVVNNSAEFEQAYESLHKSGSGVCCKYVQDEGGMSFRRIVDEIDRFELLGYYQGAKIAYHELAEILRSQESFKDMLVMPYLSGDEISVDCLATRQGLIAVMRRKGWTRDERVFFDEGIYKMCRAVVYGIGLECPCNIQFKLSENETPYLLEINTRMSGGTPMGCLASGINIPNIALNKLLGREVGWTPFKGEKTVSYIEVPQIIN